MVLHSYGSGCWTTSEQSEGRHEDLVFEKNDSNIKVTNEEGLQKSLDKMGADVINQGMATGMSGTQTEEREDRTSC